MRVVIADDAALIREGIAGLLTEAGLEVVYQVGDARALLASVRDERPDVALVDIRMPPTHTDEGLRAAREIRASYADTAVVVLSQHLEPDYALRLIEESPEGVGYLMKERVGRVEQLVDAMQRVAAGECVDRPGGRRRVARQPPPCGSRRRAHAARAGDPRADGRGTLEPGHLQGTLAEPEDRRGAHPKRLREAGDHGSGRGQSPCPRRADLPEALSRPAFRTQESRRALTSE